MMDLGAPTILHTKRSVLMEPSWRARASVFWATLASPVRPVAVPYVAIGGSSGPRRRLMEEPAAPLWLRIRRLSIELRAL